MRAYWVGVVVALGSVLLLACGGGSDTPAPTPDEEPSAGRETSGEGDPPLDADEAVSQPVAPPGREVVEGRIVGRGPHGDGACLQQSYEIEAAGVRRWVHFERCGDSPGPLFDNLVDGETYRFTLERGASPNFADEPMIVGATPTSP